MCLSFKQTPAFIKGHSCSVLFLKGDVEGFRAGKCACTELMLIQQHRIKVGAVNRSCQQHTLYQEYRRCYADHAMLSPFLSAVVYLLPWLRFAVPFRGELLSGQQANKGTCSTRRAGAGQLLVSLQGSIGNAE